MIYLHVLLKLYASVLALHSAKEKKVVLVCRSNVGFKQEIRREAYIWS